MHSFKMKKTFPETCRAFADGELSVVMERHGGLLEAALIDVLHSEDRDYPDNNAMPIFSRGASLSVNRPLFGPAIRLLSEESDGQVVYHRPEKPEVFPWGVRSRSGGNRFEMLLDRKRIMFRCASRSSRMDSFMAVISKHHLGREYNSIKNQRVGDGCEEHLRRAGLPFAPAKPLPNGKARLVWNEPVFINGWNSLLFNVAIELPYGKKDLFLAVTASAPLRLEESPSQWVLRASWQNAGEIITTFAFADTKEKALQSAKEGCSEYSRAWSRKKSAASRVEKGAPRFKAEGLLGAETFMRAAVAYQNAMLLHDTTGIRAAAHKFACFMMWDTLYPIRDFLWNGQYRQAKDLYRSMLGYPYMENSPWVVSQLILVLDEILAFDHDRELLLESWGHLEKYLGVMIKLASPETGLISSHMTTGVDLPEELGLSGLYPAADINSWWHGALRVMENLAEETGHPDVSAKVAPFLQKVEENYLKAFYSEEQGYLRSGVNEDLSPGKIEVFQNTSTIGLDYTFGPYLLRKVTTPLAQYQARRLFHPGGRAAVSWDSQTPCEMWKSVHMNQHDGHEAKLARLANMLPEARRLVCRYLEDFEHYKCAIETSNYAGCLGNETQTSDWQTFSATGVCEALRGGIAGIGRHRGGLHYIPADDDKEIFMSHLRVGQQFVDIHISGRGKHVGSMSLNGIAIPGTAQLPASLPRAKTIKWEIRRSDKPGKSPMLLNSFGLPVDDFFAEDGRVSFTAMRSGHHPILVEAHKKAALFVEGQRCPVEWDRKNVRLWCDLRVTEGDRIRVEHV